MTKEIDQDKKHTIPSLKRTPDEESWGKKRSGQYAINLRSIKGSLKPNIEDEEEA